MLSYVYAKIVSCMPLLFNVQTNILKFLHDFEALALNLAKKHLIIQINNENC